MDNIKMDEYYLYYMKYKKELYELLVFLKEKFPKVILWGAGLRGKAFLKVCDETETYIDYVIDMNKQKQGDVLPTGHRVIGIEKIDSEAVILIVNERCYGSICFDLINQGYDVKKMKLINLDQFIDGKITIKSIKENTIWKRKRYYD